VATTVQTKLQEFVNVQDDGALASASAATNSAAIDSVSDAFPSDTVQRGAVWFQPGTQLNVNSEILLNRKSLTFNGQNAALKWTGTDAAASIFKITDSSRVKFCDLVLLGDLTNPPYAALRFFRNATGDTTGTNENCTVENVVIGRKFTSDTTTGGSADVTPYAKVQYGILIDGTDGNNDEFVISNVQVHSASVAAINFNNTQSIWSSIQNVLVNDSAIGVRVGCNLHMTNINANRITTADILGIRDTESVITSFNAENSLIFIKSQGGASFFVRGGELLRNNAVASNFFRWENGGSMVLDSLTIGNNGGSGDTIYYRQGSTKGGIIRVRNCTIAGGATRSTWDIDTGAFGAPQTVIDIEHGDFVFKTKKPYLDRQLTPPAVAAAASSLLASGSANTPFGDFFHASYGGDAALQHIVPAISAANQIYIRIFNVTAGSITLAAERVRWMNLGDNITAKASAVIDVPLMTNNTGSTQTISLPGAQLGDFIAFSAGASYLNNIVTAYVSAANTVALRVHNATGGNSDPASTTLHVGKLSEFGNYKNTLAYTPALIANAATVTQTVSVPGAQLGGHTFVSYTNDLQGLICTAYVSAADTVTIVLTNYTGAGVTLGAGYFKVMVAF
jgi:hypothetical protein